MLPRSFFKYIPLALVLCLAAGSAPAQDTKVVQDAAFYQVKAQAAESATPYSRGFVCTAVHRQMKIDNLDLVIGEPLVATLRLTGIPPKKSPRPNSSASWKSAATSASSSRLPTAAPTNTFPTGPEASPATRSSNSRKARRSSAR